ncbi:Rab11 family-interacting protein 1 [Labeo rohita]|uniref:Rab11 family-interacting protein 1 n=1 Tax=Labeo rohita TaxID=84645 RepID=A0ABQ8MCJ6_LABRO|nr:Rab11 family-interacting protein 1 [Labeo rohita]
MGKTGKADKERGEVLLDIQFMKNNMTASMYDLSGQDKSRSRLGKLKDKLKGKKKDGMSDSASAIVPSVAQVLTDSEGEEEPDTTPGAKKKNKLKSLFAPKPSLHRNISQSMSTLGTLPEKDSAISLSRSSGLNVESPEGKKKFKFLKHKRTGSTDSKVSQGTGSLGLGTAQNNVCINGSHVYTEEPETRGSRAGSTFSLNSSGHGSMEDLRRGHNRKTSSTSMDSSELQTQENAVEEMHRRQEEQSKQEEEVRKRLEEERRQAEEGERKQFEREQEKMRLERDEARRRLEREEEERKWIEREEERKRIEREKERKRMEMEEERKRIEREEERKRVEREEERKRIEREEERKRMEMEEERKRIESEEERKRMEREEEKRKLQKQEEERRRTEEEERERKRIEQEEMIRIKKEQERVRQEEERRKADEERIEEEKRRQMEEEEKARKEEDKRRRMEEEERMRLENEKLRKEEETRKMEMERRRAEEEERLQKEKEKVEAEEKRKKKEEEERRLSEEKERKEQERLRLEKEKLELANKRMEERMREEQARREAEKEEENRKLKEKADQERIRQEKEEMERQKKEKEQRPEAKPRSARVNTSKKRLTRLTQTSSHPPILLKTLSYSTRAPPIPLSIPPSSVSGLFFSQASVPNTNPFLDDSDVGNTEEAVHFGDTAERSEKKRRAPMPPQNKMQMEKPDVLPRAPAIPEATQSFFSSRVSEDGRDSDSCSLRRDKRPAPLPLKNKQEVQNNHADQSTTPISRFQEKGQTDKAGPVSQDGSRTFDADSFGNSLSHLIQGHPRQEISPFVPINVKTAKHNKGPAPKPSLQSKPCKISVSKTEPNNPLAISNIHLTEHETSPASNSCIDQLDESTDKLDDLLASEEPYTKPNPVNSDDLFSRESRHKDLPAKSKLDSLGEDIPAISDPVFGKVLSNVNDPKNADNVLLESGVSKKKSQAPLPPAKSASTVQAALNSTSQPSIQDQDLSLTINSSKSTSYFSTSMVNSSSTSSEALAPLRPEADHGSGHRSLPQARVSPIDVQPVAGQKNGTESERTAFQIISMGIISKLCTNVFWQSSAIDCFVFHPCNLRSACKTYSSLSLFRPHAVKPLSTTDKQPDHRETQDGSRSAKTTDDMQVKMKAPEAKGTGPYSQLTHDELINLLEKQRQQLSQKDTKIGELEQYIDNLLVRVMEESPNILMSLNSMKKSV